jgi:hypothetical protein
VPLLVERFMDVCTAAEASLRAAATAAAVRTASHPSRIHLADVDQCLFALCFGFHNKIVESSGSLLALHLGLRGPEALALEQRHFYSTLSTVQKLGRAGLTPWGQPAANHCCAAAAHAAVELLQDDVHTSGDGPVAAAAAAATGGEQANTTPAAGVQLSQVEYLPSLVILGRCCLTWAEQLQQEAPELLLASGAAVQQQQQQQQQRGEIHRQLCAAHVYACLGGGWGDLALAVRPVG